MTNPKYARGRRFEWKTKKVLEKNGWVVLRMAGSKPIDLLALKPTFRPIMIECKTGKYVSEAEVLRVKELADKVHAGFIIAKSKTFMKEFKERGLI